MGKLFFLVMYSDFDKSRIAYAGLFDSKQEILRRCPLVPIASVTITEKDKLLDIE